MIDTGGPNVFVAAQWRSGSTHIAMSLAKCLQWRLATTAGMHGEGWEQQNINPLISRVLFPYGFQVFHQHTWGSPQNVRILATHKVPVLVITRNILDILVSLYEHGQKAHKGEVVAPGMHAPASFFNRDSEPTEEDEYAWLACHVTPWLLQFYASWHDANIEKMRVSYDGFYKDQVTGVKSIIDFLGQEPPHDKVIEAITALNHNKSVGVSGRGEGVPDIAKNIVRITAASWGTKWKGIFKEGGLL